MRRRSSGTEPTARRNACGACGVAANGSAVSERVGMLEQITLLFVVPGDHCAVEARGGHAVEHDANAVDPDFDVAVICVGGEAEAIAGPAAAGGEGDSQKTAVELLGEVPGGRFRQCEIRAQRASGAP